MTSISSNAFPSSVTSIGKDAFYGCSTLKTVTIPAGISSIGARDFYGCSSLTSITMNGIPDIGWNAIPTTGTISVPQSIYAAAVAKFPTNKVVALYEAPTRNYVKLKLTDGSTQTDVFENGVIPAEKYSYRRDIVSAEIGEGITIIGEEAFCSCTSLTSISIPNTLTSFGDYAFWFCPSLSSIAIPNSVTKIGRCAFYQCSSLTSLAIPNSVTEIGSGAFEHCSSLISITIPKSVTTIEYATFAGCSSLNSVTIPESVTTIGNVAFSDCVCLTSITIPKSVNTIEPGAFRNCASLTIIRMYGVPKYVESNAIPTTAIIIVPQSIYTDAVAKFPNNVVRTFEEVASSYVRLKLADGTNHSDIFETGKIPASKYKDRNDIVSAEIGEGMSSIGTSAFENCSSLLTLTFLSAVSISDYAFNGCKCNPLYFKKTPSVGSATFRGFSGTVLAPAAFWSRAYKAGIGQAEKQKRFFAIEGNDWSDHVFSVRMRDVTCYEPFLESVLNFENIKFSLYDGTPLSYTKTEDGYYTIKGLNVGSSNTITVSYSDSKGNANSCKFTVTTTVPTAKVTSSHTQSTITINGVTVSSDETCTLGKIGFVCKGVEYTEFPALISGLYPGENVTVQPFAYYDGIRYNFPNQTVSAEEISLDIDRQTNASSLFVRGRYSRGGYYYGKGDALITDEKITINGKTYDGNEVKVTGLDPNTSYKVTYSLYANGHRFTYDPNITTKALTMSTKNPKVINAGNVIVAAEANIDEAESNVGFEWRRTDWMDEFNSNVGTAYIYKGQMEGYIRNLNTEKLWKCRPYYLSDKGTYYYGDWVGIDPTNTSYFEPTVHTYENISVEGNSALVKGYALRGTDDVIVQGFIYWKNAGSSKSPMRKAPADATIIECKGQLMSAKLENLQYGASYSYQAFVRTSEGIVEGEIRTFETKNITIGTATKLIEVLRGNSNATTGLDINNDGSINKSDLQFTIDRILGK